jgi:hypothetical protein
MEGRDEGKQLRGRKGGWKEGNLEEGRKDGRAQGKYERRKEEKKEGRRYGTKEEEREGGDWPVCGGSARASITITCKEAWGGVGWGGVGLFSGVQGSIQRLCARSLSDFVKYVHFLFTKFTK